MVGKKDLNQVTGLKTVPKKGYLFVSRLDPSTTIEQLESYVKQSFPEAKCEALESKYPDVYAFFKIIINIDNVDKTMDTAVLATGCISYKVFSQETNCNTGNLKHFKNIKSSISKTVHIVLKFFIGLSNVYS